MASYILREKEGVTNMTLADIAEGAKVSEGSVIRFCNKLGIKKLDRSENMHRKSFRQRKTNEPMPWVLRWKMNSQRSFITRPR